MGEALHGCRKCNWELVVCRQCQCDMKLEYFEVVIGEGVVARHSQDYAAKIHGKESKQGEIYSGYIVPQSGGKPDSRRNQTGFEDGNWILVVDRPFQTQKDVEEPFWPFWLFIEDGRDKGRPAQIMRVTDRR